MTRPTPKKRTAASGANDPYKVKFKCAVVGKDSEGKEGLLSESKLRVDALMCSERQEKS